MKLNEKYQAQLDNLRHQMEQAQAFAERVPCLEAEILDDMIQPDREWVRVAGQYKDLVFPWGINRGYYGLHTPREMFNLERNQPTGYFWSMYINTLTLYDSHSKHGLWKIPEIVDVFYYDAHNSTFYCTDEQIGDLLEALNEWYLDAKVLEDKRKKCEAVEKAKEQLDKALAANSD